MSDRDPLDLLAEEFAARCRRGESPTLREYAERYPELASELAEMLPAVALLERCKLSDVVTGDAAPPRQIGDYRLIREIGRGGMGVVYEALQESLGRRVAIKILPAHFLQNSARVARFQREARAAARLHHTNIVPIFGVGSEQELHYYVMQLIPGQGLDRCILARRQKSGKINEKSAPATERPGQRDTRASTPISSTDAPVESRELDFSPAPLSSRQSWERALRMQEIDPPKYVCELGMSAYLRQIASWGSQIAEALDYAHQQGTLHRDLKPANVLIDQEGLAWLTDFGLAKVVNDSELTATGDIIGTLQYLAPECLQHAPATPQSDVYGLGMTLYEAFTFRAPYTVTQPVALLKQISETSPPPPRQANPAISRDLETIILKAISREPKQRYATAGELAADLHNFLNGRPITARRSSFVTIAWHWCRRNQLTSGLIFAALASLVLAAVVGWIGYWQTTSALSRESVLRYQAEVATQSADRNVRLSLAAFEDLFQKFSDSPGEYRAAWLEELLRPAPALRLADALRDGLLEQRNSAEEAEILTGILDFYQKFASQNITHGALQSEAIRAYHRVAQIQRRLGRTEQARAALATARELWDELIPAEQQQTAWQREWVQVLIDSAQLANAADPQAAQTPLAWATTAVQMAEGLARREGTRLNRALLAQALVQRALCRDKSGDWRRASEDFSRAEQLAEELVRQRPQFQLELAALRLLYAQAKIRHQSATEAETLLRQSIRAIQREISPPLQLPPLALQGLVRLEVEHWLALAEIYRAVPDVVKEREALEQARLATRRPLQPARRLRPRPGE
ncbi:MAG: protein kinase [Pirellulales bacterium]|nr:protein kinase [Pirellulales bacterium]